MAVLPTQLDGIVTHGANPSENGAGHGDEAALTTVALTHGARTVTTQIFLMVLADVSIVPGDAHNTTRLYVIDFSGSRAWHLNNENKLLEFDQTIAKRRHKSNSMAVH